MSSQEHAHPWPFWAGMGAAAMALAVGAGAFGAHGLEKHLAPDLLAIWQTAARYHAYHSLGLFAIAFVSYAEGQRGQPSRLVKIAGWLFIAGLVLFAGSLYTLAISGIRWLGAITPFGGASWIAGWTLLAVASFRLRSVD